MDFEQLKIWNKYLNEDLKKGGTISRDTYKKWIDILKKEIRSIFYQYKIQFPIPNVVVDDSTARWGKWESLTQTVHISKKLLLGYSWNSVVETLKHELAHMLAEKYDASQFHSEPHGTAFKNACNVLRISPKASASDADMGLALDQRQDSKKVDPYLERITKLLALSESMNENEAKEALSKANQLMIKYNLTFKDLSSRELKLEYRFLFEKSRIPTEVVLICNILKDFFFIEYILIPSFNFKKNVKTTSVEIMGTKENLDMAEYVFCFLLHQCESLWSSYKKENAINGHQRRKSYFLGVLEGVRTSLEMQQIPQQTNALAVLDNELASFFTYRYPRVRRQARSGVKIHMDSFKKGRHDGGQVAIHKPVGHQNRLYLLR